MVSCWHSCPRLCRASLDDVPTFTNVASAPDPQTTAGASSKASIPKLNTAATGDSLVRTSTMHPGAPAPRVQAPDADDDDDAPVFTNISSTGTPRPGYADSMATEYGTNNFDRGQAAKAPAKAPAAPAAPVAAGPGTPRVLAAAASSGSLGKPFGNGGVAATAPEEEQPAPELPAEQQALVDAKLASVRPELLRLVAIEAAKFALAKELRPKDAPATALEDFVSDFVKSKRAAVSSGQEKAPAFDFELGAVGWKAGYVAMLTDLQGDESLAETQEMAAPWVTAVLEAKREVIDPNHGRLSEHLMSMWAEQMERAKKEIGGSRLRTVMKAKALHVNQTLKAAMDDVERQFRDGMAPSAQQKIITNDVLEYDEVVALCAAAIRYFREGFDRPWALATIEKELLACMGAEEVPVMLSARKTMTATMEEDPVSWLLGLVLGAHELPLEREAREFVASTTATYLDPFIDGEVPASEYHARSEGFFMARLQRAWEVRCKLCDPPLDPPPPLPVPVNCALAQYVSHCIVKMNTQLGFTAHVPGVGRTPTTVREQELHFKKTSIAIIEAIARDFAEDERRLGSVLLTAAQLAHVGQIHLKGVISYQQELGDALAAANREGEEARKEERMRIWGMP